MKKRKILIIGPISESGGREINSIFFINQFRKKYDTAVFSTIPVSSKSIVDDYLGVKKMDSFERIALNNLLVKSFAQFIKWKNQLQIELLFLVKNKISNLFFDFDKLYRRILEKEISKQDIVFYSGLLNDKWLNSISKICKQKNIVLIIRITGSFNAISKYSNFLKDEKIVVHSIENYNKLVKEGFTKIKSIEQSSSLENELLRSTITFEAPLKFGYLGRMSDEKGLGIILQSFKNNKLKIVIAGSGPLEKEVISFASKYSNIKKLSFLPYKKVPEFLNHIDVLLILSKHEGGPLVGIEAMAAGKIIISTKVGAMTQRLNFVDKELLLNDYSEESLLKILDLLLQKTEEDVCVLKKKMRKYYRTFATNDIIMNKYFQFIDS